MVQIEGLELEIQANSTKASNSLDKLTKSLERMSAALNNTSFPAQKIKSLVSALNPLANIGKTNLGSTLNQLKKIPEITKGLDTATLSEFADKMKQVTEAVKPLSTEMEKVSQGFSRLPANIQRAIAANSRLTKSTAKLGGSLRSLGLAAFTTNLKHIYNALERVANVIGNWIAESNDYVENLNLFTVAMGEYASSAQAYAEQVSEIMGIDPSEWMRAQGVFMTLATGFGVASDKAALMSKNLTQLGYDISSFFNISSEDAMQKLQSAVSGELEPLRRLGWDLSQAKLGEIALSLGIKESVMAMNQAEKAQLRYYAILTQVTSAQGDMARTLQSPANQLRILKAQLTQAARALGNIFIPALNAVLPYAIAFIKVIRTMANEIANLFGFELPEVDYSGLDTVTSGAEEASEAVSELKKSLLGMDEINVLNPSSASATGTDLGLDIDLPEYDFLGDNISTRVNDLASAMENLKTPILAIASGLAVAAVIQGVMSFVNNMGSLASIFSNPYALIVGAIAAAIVAIVLAIKNDFDEKKAADMAARFGDIALSMEQVDAMATQLTSGNLQTALDVFGDAFDTLGNVASKIDSNINTLNSYNWKVTVGIELSEGEQKDYKSTIESYIANVEEFSKQAQLTATIAVAVNLSDTSAGEGLQTFINTYFADSQTKLKELGKKLRDEVNSAFADGVLSNEEYETIINLQKEMQEITSKLSTAEFKATLTSLRLDNASGTDLDVESFKELMASAQAKINEQKKSLDGVRLEQLKIAELKYASDGNTTEYNAAVAEIQSQYRKSLADLESATSEFGFGTLKDAWKDDWAVASKELWGIPADALKEAYTAIAGSVENAYQGSADKLIQDMQRYFATKISDMNIDLNYDDAAKANLKKMLETLAPSASEMQKIADSAIAAGQAVPENIAKGLNDYYQLKALTGDTQAINYLVGQMLSTDKSFLEMLTTAEGAGNKIDKSVASGILNNIGEIKTAFENLTPILAENLYAMGVTCGNAFARGVVDAANYSIATGGYSNDALTFKEKQMAKLDGYASGGFPSTGEMFIAREAGPELVGTIGGRTAIANNDQITTGIASAVYQAFVSANSTRGNGGNWTIQVVDTDGRVKSETVISAAERKNRRDGKTIIPLGV